MKKIHQWILVLMIISALSLVMGIVLLVQAKYVYSALAVVSGVAGLWWGWDTRRLLKQAKLPTDKKPF